MNENAFLTEAAPPSKKEFLELISMLDPQQPFSKLITSLYLLKSLLLEEGHYEKGLTFGKRIREFELVPFTEDVKFKADIIAEVKMFLAPFWK